MIQTLLVLTLAAAAAETPKLLGAGASTPSQVQIGSGVVLLELRVEEGRVTGTRRLKGRDAFLELLEADVADWRFEVEPGPVRVLAAGVYRPAQLMLDAPLDPGPSLAEADASVPSPTHTEVPAYPPDSVGNGAAVVEVLVGPDGGVTESRAIAAKPGFGRAALDAARQWRFEPARDEGRPVPARACLVFAFREPVVPPVQR